MVDDFELEDLEKMDIECTVKIGDKKIPISFTPNEWKTGTIGWKGQGRITYDGKNKFLAQMSVYLVGSKDR